MLVTQVAHARYRACDCGHARARTHTLTQHIYRRVQLARAPGPQKTSPQPPTTSLAALSRSPSFSSFPPKPHPPMHPRFPTQPTHDSSTCGYYCLTALDALGRRLKEADGAQVRVGAAVPSSLCRLPALSGRCLVPVCMAVRCWRGWLVGHHGKTWRRSQRRTWRSFDSGAWRTSGLALPHRANLSLSWWRRPTKWIEPTWPDSRARHSKQTTT